MPKYCILRSVFFCLFFILLSPKNTNAQRPKPVISTLLQAQTEFKGVDFGDIAQDSRGFIWFASLNKGIYRYDGKTILPYEGNYFGADGIIRIKKCSDNRVWLLDYSGLLLYLDNDSLIPYAYNDSIIDRTKKGHLISFDADSLGVLHLGIKGKGYFTVSKEGELSHRIKKGQGYNGLVHIKTLSGTSIFFRNYDIGNSLDTLRVYLLDHRLKLLNSYILETGRGSYFKNVNYITADKNGGYFVSNFSKTIYQITSSKEVIIHSIPDIAKEIMVDSRNNLWISSNQLIMYPNCNITDENQYLFEDHPRSLVRFEDNDGIIWIISSMPTSISYISQLEVRHITNNRLNGLFSVLSVDDTLFTGGYFGLNKMIPDKNSGLTYNTESNLNFESPTRALFWDSKSSKVWFLSGYGVLSLLNENISMVNDQHIYKPRQILSFKNQIIVLGERQLAAYEDSLMVSITKDKDILIRSGCNVNDSMLVILIGHELFVWKDNKFIKFSTNPDLEKLQIMDIDYFNNELWIESVTREVYVYSKDKLRQVKIGGVYLKSSAFNVLNPKLMLLNCEFGLVEVGVDSLGRSKLEVLPCDVPVHSHFGQDVSLIGQTYYIATSEGLFEIMAENIKRTIFYPELIIESVTYGKVERELSQNYNLNYTENLIRIKYTGINLKFQSKPVSFRYKFSGIYDNWQLTSDRQLTLANIPPGKYEFEIQTRIPNAPWGKSSTISFNIAPPYWQTWWFRGLVILLFAALIVIATTARNRIKQRQLQFQLNEVQAEQRALRAQVNPHFIFNVISAAQYLTEKTPKKASAYLGELAKLMRKILDQSFLTFVPLQSELEMTQSYLALEQMRMDNRFSFEIDVDPKIETEKFTIPSMLLQPFVENCVKHGIQPSEKKCKIQIGLQMVNLNELIIVIEDNGVGRSIGNAKINSGQGQVSYGMKMSQERIELMNKIHGRKARLEVKDLGNEKAGLSGTRISIFMTI